jgi:hypothetical protein
MHLSRRPPPSPWARPLVSTTVDTSILPLPDLPPPDPETAALLARNLAAMRAQTAAQCAHRHARWLEQRASIAATPDRYRRPRAFARLNPTEE